MILQDSQGNEENHDSFITIENKFYTDEKNKTISILEPAFCRAFVQ